MNLYIFIYLNLIHNRLKKLELCDDYMKYCVKTK